MKSTKIDCPAAELAAEASQVLQSIMFHRLLSLQVMLDDHILKAQTMHSSAYIKPFEEEMKEWEDKLISMQVMFATFSLGWADNSALPTEMSTPSNISFTSFCDTFTLQLFRPKSFRFLFGKLQLQFEEMFSS
jgi:hypothetical protein